MRRYLKRVTGISKAQRNRLVKKHDKSGKLALSIFPPVWDWEEGVELLREAAVILNQNPAMWPLVEHFMPVEYEWLALYREFNSNDLKTVLNQNFPNPFNPETMIPYTPAESSEIRLVIYSQLGQQIRTLVSQSQTAGIYSVTWDGRDQFGREMSSGVYIYRLTAGEKILTQRMMLVK